MMIKIKIITLFPDLIKAYLAEAFIAKALSLKLLNIELINLRDFSDNTYRSVDEAPYGGGDGMLIRADILEKALLSIQNTNLKQKIIYFTPQGKCLNQAQVKTFSSAKDFDELILICGRYAGIDQRFVDHYVQQEISIGNYVLSGGELPALVFLEAITRFIPGVLGKAESAEEDSFKDNLLEAPQYTRPQVWNDLKVPEVLLSGNHQKIAQWKKDTAQKLTLQKRPDLMEESKK